MATRETYEKATPLQNYIEEKLDMLKKDFRIKLNAYEEKRMRLCRTEMQVDSYAHSLIMQKL